LDELKDSIKSIPGGSAQNTLRVFQWVLGAIGGPVSLRKIFLIFLRQEFFKKFSKKFLKFFFDFFEKLF